MNTQATEINESTISALLNSEHAPVLRSIYTVDGGKPSTGLRILCDNVTGEDGSLNIGEVLTMLRTAHESTWHTEGHTVLEHIANNAHMYELRGADLRGADLRERRLINKDLRGADLRNADLRGADLRNADLRGADLRNADLRSADLRNADLRGADLRSADLRSADLTGADLRSADLTK
jgi:hypothetical protein